MANFDELDLDFELDAPLGGGGRPSELTSDPRADEWAAAATTTHRIGHVRDISLADDEEDFAAASLGSRSVAGDDVVGRARRGGPGSDVSSIEIMRGAEDRESNPLSVGGRDSDRFLGRPDDDDAGLVDLEPVGAADLAAVGADDDDEMGFAPPPLDDDDGMDAGLLGPRASGSLGAVDDLAALEAMDEDGAAVLLQAQARRAAFVVAPCCIGKLRDGGLKSVAGMKNAISTADGDGDGKTDDLDDELVVRPGGGMPPLTVIHPRSRWMRGEVQRPAYMDMAAAADWSGHAGVDAMEAFTGELGRLPRAAKAAVELDRGAAAAEAGYGVRMMKMLHPGAGLKNDVIVGFPRGADPLREHVFGPNASF